MRSSRPRVEQTQAMARLDIEKGQPDQPDAVSLVGMAGLHSREDVPILREIIGRDEGELLEQHMARRNIAEDLQHGRCDAPAHPGQRLGQAQIVQNLPCQGMACKVRADKGRVDRHAEEDVLADRRVLRVARRIIGLDRVLTAPRSEDGADAAPDFRDPAYDVRRVVEIEPWPPVRSGTPYSASPSVRRTSPVAAPVRQHSRRWPGDGRWTSR